MTLRNRYCHLLPPEWQPRTWHPPAIDERVFAETSYWGEVLAEMDRRVGRDDLVVHLTEDLERLPSYGPNVVAVVLADEKAHIPPYADRVAAIFKNNAVRPLLTTSFLREPTWINAWWFVSYLRLWYHHAPGAAHWLGLRLRGRRAAPVWMLPIGTLTQVELPLLALDERPTDVFFAGSVSHLGRPSIRERISPKVQSRKEMLRAAERLAKARPEVVVHLFDSGAFHLSIQHSGEQYSRALMDAKIALVPRGVVADTFRFWQALRAGCVVITDTLPRHRFFYDGAPVVRVRRWADLDEVVPALLADPARMRDLHERGLEWFRTRGSPAAVGAYMAERLDRL